MASLCLLFYVFSFFEYIPAVYTNSDLIRCRSSLLRVQTSLNLRKQSCHVMEFVCWSDFALGWRFKAMSTKSILTFHSRRRWLPGIKNHLNVESQIFFLIYYPPTSLSRARFKGSVRGTPRSDGSMMTPFKFFYY